jgi:UDP-N-acetylglucosamine--N-acetylmuramyl-(pentapeptide) pyrophosphoryl-undecaprenol N-acetylglucosamine transferase
MPGSSRKNCPKKKKWTKAGKFMNQSEHKRIVISGGGTGGHVFPAISIANAVRSLDPGADILFVGAQGRIEMEKVPEAGYRIIGLPVEGVRRRITLKNIGVLCRLISSLRKAGQILREFRPHVVVGVGGYASGPILRKAGKMGIPILIQEQNSYAGVTNKLMSRQASVICVAYEGMERYFPAGRIILTGNPVRQNLENLDSVKAEALSFFKIDKGKPVVLVLGGSLGAGSINDSLSCNLDLIAGSGCIWLWQTGKYYFESISALVGSSGSGNIKVHGFINRMDYAYAAADVIVSRSGAGTISELCLAGRPVILIPSPNVAEDHQTKNARALADKDAAIMIPDSQAKAMLAVKALELVADEARRRTLATNISALARRDADRRIAEEVLKLAGR